MRRRLGAYVVRILVLAFLLVSALPTEAQDLAAREQHLRRRVEEVYRLFVTGEWRKVEPYVSADTRDLWSAQPKSTIDSYEIGEIKMDPDGRRADVTIRATFRVPQGPMSFTMSQKSEWVFEKEQWYLKVKKFPALLQMFPATGSPSTP